jgi:gamma-glutamylcysteine synthetase
MAQTIRSSFEELADRFARAFPPQLETPRTVGREAEYPLVTPEGAAVDLSPIWSLLMADGGLDPKFDAVNPELIVGLEGIDYGYALEVGRSTIEIYTRPCPHLLELQDVQNAALHRLIAAAEQLGWRVLGYGIQPLTPPSAALMSPKQRYQAMLDIMGEDWLWYTVSASEQLHVDVARPEMIRLLNLGLLMTPVVVAFCGNSPIYAGKVSDFCSAREGMVTQRGQCANRHGMPDRPYRDLPDFVERLTQLPFLLRREGSYLLPDGRPFVEVLAAEGVDFESFLLHDHYVWHSARLRVAHATLEMRPACQQPPHEEMAAAALYLGIVEAADQIEGYLLANLGEQSWDALKHYHGEAMRHGLAAPQPIPDFLATVLGFAENSLRRRDYGEEALLQPLWRRLNAKQNPAQYAKEIFARAGIGGIVESFTLNHEDARMS